MDHGRARRKKVIHYAEIGLRLRWLNKVPEIPAAFLPSTWAFLEQVGQQIASQGLGSLAPIEEGLLKALKLDGTRFLEQLLNQSALPVPRQELESGEENYGLRETQILTLLGSLTLRRSYYYHPNLERGRAPLDDAFGLDLGYSPAAAKLMCRAGARSSGFADASQDLQA